MKEWLILATNVAVDVIDWLALILIVVGAVEAFFQGLWTMFASRDGHHERDVWLRLGRWLVAGLTFQLAADVLETAITTSWDEVARLARDRRDPHVPQLFSRTRSRRDPGKREPARRRSIAPLAASDCSQSLTDWCEERNRVHQVTFLKMNTSSRANNIPTNKYANILDRYRSTFPVKT